MSVAIVIVFIASLFLWGLNEQVYIIYCYMRKGLVSWVEQMMLGNGRWYLMLIRNYSKLYSFFVM